MFCPKCGTNLPEESEFCSNCGTNIKNLQVNNSVSQSNLNNENEQPMNNIQNNSVSQNSEGTMTEMLSNKSKAFLNPIKEKIKIFISKYKKQIFIGLGILVIICILIIIYGLLFGFEKLKWDKTYEDYKLEYITQSKVKLKVDFSNEKKIDDIKYSTTCGKIKSKGLVVDWDLTDAVGKCKIEVSYKLKKISKTFTVINPFAENQELSLDYEIDLESDEDLDYDGLTNKQEKEYKTDPEVADSDLDGLDDYYEIFTSKTDPNKKDTDADGLNDYDEIQLGLDPNKADSKNDGTKDGNRTLTYNYSDDKLKLSITGKGNIASSISQVNSNTKISSKKGLIDNLYTLYTDGTIEEAILTISYTTEEIEKNGLNEDNLSIYYYNEKESKYEKLESTVDKENKTVTAKLKHFSSYVVGDSSLVKETTTNQILFVLDNSWSMYTDEQYEEYTGKTYSGGLFGTSHLDGFDAEGIRFTLTSDLASRLSSKNYQIGLSEFRSDYANALSIGSDASSIKKKLTTMTGKFITNSEGTNISNALISGISEFSQDSDNKYIVILTDGQDTSLSSRTKSIIEKATASNVKICSIGFGGGSYNTELSSISNGTGCKFYSSSNALGLTELFENIGSELDDNLVDVNGDNKADGILMADSGFVVNRDGFSFANYGTNLSKNGHCYGMATFAQLYYKKALPLTLGSKTADKDKAYSYDLTNTYFKDYSNLYDFKFKTSVLKNTFGFEVFGEEQPKDYMTLAGTTLVYGKKYKEELEKSKMYDITIDKSGLDAAKQLERWGVNYKDAENALLNEDNMQSSSVIDKADKNLLNAIYSGFIRQNTITHYSSSSNWILWLRNVIGKESVDYTGAQGFINILKSRLDDKDAPVISSTFSGGLHAINAISLVQDKDNPNLYYIGVYDNNYPNEKRYVDIECNKDTCVTKANNYYSGSGEPIRITPSLEYDLEYFK